MRSLIVSNIVSLDGFYEGPERNVMALNMDQAFDAYNLERIRSAGTMLLGRSSFEAFSTYWSRVADAPADPDNRALSNTNREISRIYNRIPKVVVSDSLIPHDNPWRQDPAMREVAIAELWSRLCHQETVYEESATSASALFKAAREAPLSASERDRSTCARARGVGQERKRGGAEMGRRLGDVLPRGVRCSRSRSGRVLDHPATGARRVGQPPRQCRGSRTIVDRRRGGW